MSPAQPQFSVQMAQTPGHDADQHDKTNKIPDFLAGYMCLNKIN